MLFRRQLSLRGNNLRLFLRFQKRPSGAILRRIEKFMKPGNEKNLAFNMDFISVQNYTREIVRHTSFMPYMNAKIIRADKRDVEATLMNWEVYPESIYYVLKKFGSYKNMPSLIVTENGAAFTDIIVNGEVDDVKRQQYIQDNISQVLRAKREGIKVNGYFVWTLLDNFEWAEGYYPRFGLVYVDFATQKRIIKSSGYWYADFLKESETIKVST